MLFVFECPTCGARIEADASASGRQAHCPQCQGMVAVPESRVDCGATLGGFRLDRRLGKGGMGEVFLATQLSVVPPASAEQPDRHCGRSDCGFRRMVNSDSGDGEQ